MEQPEEDIRSLLDKHAADVAAGDAQAAMSTYAADAVVFDLPPPLQVQVDPDGLQDWINGWDQPPAITYRDISITTSGDLAMAWGFVHTAVKRGGEAGGFWTRTSWAFRRENGAWKIVHAHNSVPLYMDGSERAALDLKPETGKARIS